MSKVNIKIDGHIKVLISMERGHIFLPQGTTRIPQRIIRYPKGTLTIIQGTLGEIQCLTTIIF
jgi:hypothetical protein